MSRAVGLYFLVVLGLLASCADGLSCGSCGSCGAPPMAEVVQKHGELQASRAASPTQFERAEVGIELALGDALRTGRESTAKIALDDGGELAMRPSTTLRFSATRPGQRGRRIDVLAGEAVLTVQDESLLSTGNGVLRAAAGSQVRLRREGDRTELVVLVGSARLELEGEAAVDVAIGRTVLLESAGARLSPPDAASEPASAGGAASTPTAEAPAGSVSAITRGAHQVSVDGGAFVALEEGSHRLAPGTRIRQLDGGSIELTRGEQRLTIRGAAAMTLGSGATLLSRLDGSPTVESSTDGVLIATEGGVLVTRPAGARTVARLGRDEARRTTVRVEQGALEVRRGESVDRLSAGDERAFEPLTGADASLLADRVDLTLGAGEGLVIRDPDPPTALGIVTGRLCPETARVEVLEGNRAVGAAEGAGTVPVFFAEGSLTYRVRCPSEGAWGEPVATGRVRILRASGQAPLPRNAPESQVEADGRTYQILYSNRLPGVNVRWPNGPDESGRLVISGGRSVAVAGPRHRFASGSLGEGTHRLHFEAAGRRSRDTTVVIRFDPTAAAASIESPADGSFGPGETVRVSGMVSPGNSVEVEGRAIPVGGDQRFSGEVVAPSSGALVIRLVRDGQASLYLRRPRGGAP